MDMIDAEGVRQALTMPQCIAAMETAMRAVTEQSAAVPPRIIMPLVDGSAYFGVMPGSMADPKVYGAKVVSLHPANPAAGRPAIQGFVVLFDHATGEPMALLDGAEITAIRTAAASGLATRLLARPDASTLGIFGTGVQALHHLDATCAVRPIRTVRVWGRSPDKARAFASLHDGRSGAEIMAAELPHEAAACDVICTVTASAEPILFGASVPEGSHVNLVGAHSPAAREADSDLIRRGRLFVDSTGSAYNEAGDILIPLGEGAIERSHVLGEIGAVLLGAIPGRQAGTDITIYKSLGVVPQDLVAAQIAYANWRTSRTGEASPR